MSPRIFILPFCFMFSMAWAAEHVVIPAPVLAPEPDASPIPPGTGPLTATEREQLLVRAKTLRTQVDQKKAESEATYVKAQAECWKKTLVSSCLDEAKLAKRKETELIRQLEREARTIERDVKKHDAAENDIKRTAENKRRDAEMEARAARFRAEQEKKDAEKAEKGK